MSEEDKPDFLRLIAEVESSALDVYPAPALTAEKDCKSYASQYAEISANDYAKSQIHMYEAMIADG